MYKRLAVVGMVISALLPMAFLSPGEAHVGIFRIYTDQRREK